VFKYVEVVKKYALDLGVEVQITELDIEMPNVLNGEYVQGKYFKRLMEELIAARKEGVPITAVTFWGISDAVSWKASYQPLLFQELLFC